MSFLQARSRRGEVRRAVRHALHFPAFLTDGDQMPRRNCIIHDISLNGARLTIGAQANVPDEFTLVFTRTCRVVRRTDGQVGVEFLSGE